MYEKKLSKKSLALGASILIAVLGTFMFFEWANNPVVNNPAPTPNVKGTSTEVNLAPFTGENFITQIPDIFTTKKHDQSDHGNKLEQVFLTVKNNSLSNPLSDQIGITIGRQNSEGLNGLSDVQLRLRHPEDYTPYYTPGLPLGYIAFETANSPNYELSIFWPNNNKYAAVVVAGVTARKAELQNTGLQAVSSWQWR